MSVGATRTKVPVSLILLVFIEQYGPCTYTVLSKAHTRRVTSYITWLLRKGYIFTSTVPKRERLRHHKFLYDLTPRGEELLTAYRKVLKVKEKLP